MPPDPRSPSPPPPPVVASPESQSQNPDGTEESPTNDDNYNRFTIHRDDRQTSVQLLRHSRAKADERNELHPYVQTLSLSDLESCIALENAIFPEQERCSREKVGKSSVSRCLQSSPSKRYMPASPTSNFKYITAFITYLLQMARYGFNPSSASHCTKHKQRNSLSASNPASIS